MSVCAVVFEKVNIREDGKVKPKVGRIIIAFEDQDSGEVSYISKYIHYPSWEFVYSEFGFRYNGIDANTIATQGEKLATVVDWVRAAIRLRKVIVCGSVDMKEFAGATPCTIVDLQSFFYTEEKGGQIIEPISLARLANKYFGYDANLKGRRDPFEECTLRIALYHVMIGCRISGIAPPFMEATFPKVGKFNLQQKHQLHHPYKMSSQRTISKREPPENDSWDVESTNHDGEGTCKRTDYKNACSSQVDGLALSKVPSLLSRFNTNHNLSLLSAIADQDGDNINELFADSAQELNEHLYENDTASICECKQQQNDTHPHLKQWGPLSETSIPSSQVHKKSHYLALEFAHSGRNKSVKDDSNLEFEREEKPDEKEHAEGDLKKQIKNTPPQTLCLKKEEQHTREESLARSPTYIGGVGRGTCCPEADVVKTLKKLSLSESLKHSSQSSLPFLPASPTQTCDDTKCDRKDIGIENSLSESEESDEDYDDDVDDEDDDDEEDEDDGVYHNPNDHGVTINLNIYGCEKQKKSNLPAQILKSVLSCMTHDASDTVI